MSGAVPRELPLTWTKRPAISPEEPLWQTAQDNRADQESQTEIAPTVMPKLQDADPVRRDHNRHHEKKWAGNEAMRSVAPGRIGEAGRAQNDQARRPNNRSQAGCKSGIGGYENRDGWDAKEGKRRPRLRKEIARGAHSRFPLTELLSIAALPFRDGRSSAGP